MSDTKYETIEVNMSEDEKEAVCSKYVSDHFRPESISVFEDTNDGDYATALVNAVINEFIIQTLTQYIDSETAKQKIEEEAQREEGALNEAND